VAGLQRVAEAFALDRVALAEFPEDLTVPRVKYWWGVPGIAPPLYPSLPNAVPWYARQLKQGKMVCCTQLDDFPAESIAEQWRQQGRRGTKSFLALPLSAGGAVAYVMSCVTCRAIHAWPRRLIVRLGLIGELFVQALLRQRTEEASRRLGHELAHAARVTMLGELLASMAHELNQPLAAILSNAQAARRFLNMESPALAEVREALTDIIADDQRAGMIIQQLRSLGKKALLEHTPLDVNTLVQQVVRLVQSDARERRVTISLDLATGLPLSAVTVSSYNR
jgi:signal transduction histidine kinase